MINYRDIESLIASIKCLDYTFSCSYDDEVLLAASYDEPDAVTGVMTKQWTREWCITRMNKDQIVQTAFKCALTSMEHRTREHFLYKNRPIFGPHFDIEKLWSISEDRN